MSHGLHGSHATDSIKDKFILFSTGGKKNLCFDFKLHKTKIVLEPTVFEEDMAINCWSKR